MVWRLRMGVGKPAGLFMREKYPKYLNKPRKRAMGVALALILKQKTSDPANHV